MSREWYGSEDGDFVGRREREGDGAGWFIVGKEEGGKGVEVQSGTVGGAE